MAVELVVRKVTNTEYWIGPTLVRLAEGGLVDIKAVGPQNYETATAHKYVFDEIHKEFTKPLSFLIDLNNAGKNSAEARKIWKDLTDDPKMNKVALVGIHPVARVIAGFVLSVSSKSKMQFFSTREKALKWIYD